MVALSQTLELMECPSELRQREYLEFALCFHTGEDAVQEVPTEGAMWWFISLSVCAGGVLDICQG